MSESVLKEKDDIEELVIDRIEEDWHEKRFIEKELEKCKQCYKPWIHGGCLLIANEEVREASKCKYAKYL